MKKVKVNEETFVALNVLLEHINDYNINDNMHYYVRKFQDGRSWGSELYKPLNKISLDVFIRCVYIGYELEEPRETQIPFG